MKKFILSTTAMIMLSSSAAFALTDLETQSIVNEFATAQKIEIKRGLLTTKVEVIIGGVRYEYTYSNTVGSDGQISVLNVNERPVTVEEANELSRDYGIEVETDDDENEDHSDDLGEDHDDDDHRDSVSSHSDDDDDRIDDREDDDDHKDSVSSHSDDDDDRLDVREDDDDHRDSVSSHANDDDDLEDHDDDDGDREDHDDD